MPRRPRLKANRGLEPSMRVRAVNSHQVHSAGAFVLYWMIAARRPAWNHALDRAIGWAHELRLPLVVLEALRVDYPWASDRLHRFVIDGMRDNASAFSRTAALYYPYVEPAKGAGKGLLSALARDAAVVVTDEFPCFFLPRMVEAAGAALDVRLEAVDGNGLLPLASTARTFAAAVHFRWHVQRALPRWLDDAPAAHPFRGARLARLDSLPARIGRRWPRAADDLLEGGEAALRELPIDHGVAAVSARGGASAARRALGAFVKRRLDRYDSARSHPDEDGTSRLSPYLHFGHLSAHEVFAAVMAHERWTRGRLAARPTGRRAGWWGVRPPAEAFLEQLIVWRELAYNFTATRPRDYDRYESLPDWARRTLERHRTDRRAHAYAPEALEAAATHDALWNASMRQLLRDGWCHNSLRMLWGKKILEWSSSPEQAFEAMVRIMNRWSLDGRDPNSYAGYGWTLGRYDRPWPEREIYGKVRSMSSARAARKWRASGCLDRYGA